MNKTFKLGQLDFFHFHTAICNNTIITQYGVAQ